MKIKFYLLTLLAAFLFSHAYAMTDDPTDNAHYGYIENKGQIHDQNGNVRTDLRYLYYNDQFKVQLRDNGFSYEFVKTDYVQPFNTESGLRKEDKDENATEYNTQYTVNRIDIDFVNANKNVKVISEGSSPFYRNYFNQYTGSAGITYIHSFNSVTYQNLYNGIDLVFSSEKKADGKIYPKYEFIVHPNGNIADIALNYKGDFDFSIVNGSMKLNTSQGYAQESQPVYLFSDGRTSVNGKFIRHGSTVSFINVKRSAGETITIDPTIEWGTYWGGNQKDLTDEIAVDHENNLYVTGRTRSASNVATVGSYQSTLAGGIDIPLMKWAPDGTLEWSTYYGGGKNEIGFCVAVDPYDQVWIGGHTFSTNGIATADAMQKTFGGVASSDFSGVLAKFSSAGILMYGTYFGGAGQNEFQNIWADDDGSIYGSGLAESLDSIVYSTCFDCIGDDSGDIIIMKFDNAGHQIWANYWGGLGERDRGHGITTSGNNLYTTGTVESSTGIVYGNPGGNAFQTVYQSGGSDMYIARWDKNTGVPIWSCYFGGTGGERGRDIRCDRDGYIYFVGQTESGFDNLATPGAWKTSFVYTQDNRDAIVAKFDSNCNKIAATYFGADGIEMPRSLRVAAEGSPIYIGGYTKSDSGFVTGDAFDKKNKKNNDAFWARFNWNLTNLDYCTYFGGKKQESVTEPGWYGPTMDVDGNDNVYLSSGTNSTDGIAYGNAYDSTLYSSDQYDFFVAKFNDPCPDGFEPNGDFSTATRLDFRNTTSVTRYAPLQDKNDKDYFYFSTPAGMNNLQVTLSDLPFDYNLFVYDSTQTQIGKGTNTGTTNEVVIANGTYTGKYYALVKSKDKNNYGPYCYNLTVNTSNTPFRLSDESALGSISLYPNPATESTSLQLDCKYAGKCLIEVCDLQGKILFAMNQSVDDGTQIISLPVANLSSGTYLVKVNGNGMNDVVKLLIQK